MDSFYWLPYIFHNFVTQGSLTLNMKAYNWDLDPAWVVWTFLTRQFQRDCFTVLQLAAIHKRQATTATISYKNISKHIKIKVSIIFLKGIHFNTQILWYTAFYLWPTDLAKIPCNLLNFCIFHDWTLNCHNSVNLLARSPKFCMVVDLDNTKGWWQWSWWWWWRLWW